MKPAAFAPLALLFAAACGLAAAPATAAETFAYRFLPGKSTLRYAILSDEGNREVFAGLSGTLEFTLHDDDTITATAFDLTIEGPFYDDVLAVPDWAPFAPGDKLADYLAADFASTTGIKFVSPPLNGQTIPPAAIVGPDAEQRGDLVTLGLSYYYIQALNSNPTSLTFAALAGDEFGGTFEIHPDVEIVDGPLGPGGGNLGGDVVVPMLRVVPNIVRIPEPSAAALLVAGTLALALGVRRRRR